MQLCVDTSYGKKADWAGLKSDIIDKLEELTSGLNSLKIKVDEVNVDKLEPAPVDFKKLSDAVGK